MRQVPRYLIIGNGRVAKHFCHYFDLLQLPYQQWSRHADNTSTLPAKIDNATHILLLIADGAIEEFYLQHLQGHDKTLIHCSGALAINNVIGAHPLMTFSHELYDLATYESIHFIVDVNAQLADILPGLNNPCHSIPKEAKAHYHALCVMSGNFSCILWQKLFNELESKYNIPHTAAMPYFQQQTKNLMQSPQAALTGPLVRDDKTTIAKNLNSLASDPYQQVYQAFVDAFNSQKELS